MDARPRSVRAYNRTIAQNATRQVFYRTPPPIDFVKAHLGTRQIRMAVRMEHLDETSGNASCVSLLERQRASTHG